MSHKRASERRTVVSADEVSTGRRAGLGRCGLGDGRWKDERGGIPLWGDGLVRRQEGMGKEKGVELVVWWWYVAAVERSVLYIHRTYIQP
jgi:hypothetical protein